MKQFIQSKIVVIVAMALIACAFIFSGSFKSCSKDKETIRSYHTEIAGAQQAASSINSSYVAGINHAEKTIDSLKRELSIAKLRIKALKDVSTTTKVKIVRIATMDTSGVPVDTQLSYCDSLKKSAIDFTDQSDSLQAECEREINTYAELVTQKDSTIELCHRSYMAMKQLNDEQVQREQQLTDNLAKSLKTNRREAIKTRLATVGLILASSLAATLYLTSKH